MANEVTSLESKTVKELKAILDSQGIEYTSRDTKAELIAKLGG